MELLSYQSPDLPPVVAATIGTFDGVHLGHRRIIELAIKRGHELSGAACVVTFDRHPREVVIPGRAPSVLTTLEQKLALIDVMGIEFALILPFTKELAALSPESFCNRTFARLNLRHLFVGENFRFGAGRIGDAQTLRACGERLGFEVTAVPLVRIGGEPVSSTRVRDLVLRGQVAEVWRLLGRFHAVSGTIVPGDRRGAKLGFPTANVVEDDRLCLPRNGVYAGVAHLDNQTYLGVANVGVRPTFGKGRRILEVHLLDYGGDAYGRRLSFEFRHRLRTERRFSTIEALKSQISEDVSLARELLENSPH